MDTVKKVLPPETRLTKCLPVVFIILQRLGLAGVVRKFEHILAPACMTNDAQGKLDSSLISNLKKKKYISKQLIAAV